MAAVTSCENIYRCSAENQSTNVPDVELPVKPDLNILALSCCMLNLKKRKKKKRMTGSIFPNVGSSGLPCSLVYWHISQW